MLGGWREIDQLDLVSASSCYHPDMNLHCHSIFWNNSDNKPHISDTQVNYNHTCG